MKKFIDNIILGLFYIGCLISFLLLVCELPNLINDLFNTTIFENATTISFYFCVFILVYSINYLDDLKDKEKEEYYKQRINIERKLTKENNDITKDK